MEGEDRFSSQLRDALRSQKLDGKHIVETSNLILLEDYSDIEYDNELFSTFNLIVDEYRDGLEFDQIEKTYKPSFLESVAEFRKLFSI